MQLLSMIRTVLWSFFGIRKRSSHEAWISGADRPECCNLFGIVTGDGARRLLAEGVGGRVPRSSLAARVSTRRCDKRSPRPRDTLARGCSGVKIRDRPS